MDPLFANPRPFAIALVRSGETARDLFFAFASGRLTYDCVSCAAQCCRGHGYMLPVGELRASHLRARPGLPLFIDRTGPVHNEAEVVANCAPGCFFLTSDGRCEIHAEHGPSAKPETCRLFPFNDFYNFGGALLVLPNTLICPLELVPVDRRSDASDHNFLSEELARHGVSSFINPCHITPADAAQILEVERRVLALSEQCLGSHNYVKFVRDQIALDDLVADVTPPPNACNFENKPSAMIQAAAELLGTPGELVLGESAELVDVATAATPYLRVCLLMQVFGRAGRRNRWTVANSQLALESLGVYLLAEAARRAGMKRVTFRTLAKLQRDAAPLCRLMSMLPDVVTWRSRVSLKLDRFPGGEIRARYERLAAALLEPRQRRAKAPLIDLLVQHSPRDPVERVDFIKRVSHATMDCLRRAGTADEPPSLIPFRTRVVSALERLAVGYAQ